MLNHRESVTPHQHKHYRLSNSYGHKLKEEIHNFKRNLYSFNQIQKVQYGMTIAKKTILLMWNKEFTPKFEMWLKEFSNVLHMEKIRYEIAGKPKRFVQIWKSFFEYLEGDNDN